MVIVSVLLIFLSGYYLGYVQGWDKGFNRGYIEHIEETLRNIK